VGQFSVSANKQRTDRLKMSVQIVINVESGARTDGAARKKLAFQPPKIYNPL